VADRVADSVSERDEQPGTVEVVTERHDAVALLRDGAEPVAVSVHERCEVP
jgi:hypothetical protein